MRYSSFIDKYTVKLSPPGEEPGTCDPVVGTKVESSPQRVFLGNWRARPSMAQRARNNRTLLSAGYTWRYDEAPSFLPGSKAPRRKSPPVADTTSHLPARVSSDRPSRFLLGGRVREQGAEARWLRRASAPHYDLTQKVELERGTI